MNVRGRLNFRLTLSWTAKAPCLTQGVSSLPEGLSPEPPPDRTLHAAGIRIKTSVAYGSARLARLGGSHRLLRSLHADTATKTGQATGPFSCGAR
jgi:hypothetical protein